MSETPQVCPSPADLDLLELIRSGAYRPTAEHPVRLGLPLSGHALDTVELVDPEGVPLTSLPVKVLEDRLEADLRDVPTWTGRLSSRPFENLYERPADVRAVIERGARVIVANRRVKETDLAGTPNGGPIVLIVLAGPSTAPSARTLDVLRSVHQLAASRPNIRAVAIPLNAQAAAAHPDLYAAVLDAYAPRGRVILEADADALPAGGAVLLFTGLSGSGKSTISRAVRNAMLEAGRPVTLLDGDIVRRNLSAGLGFSAADRETNIRRIGWVAAQIAHHGGIAICSPIAPYASTRQDVRDAVTDAGGHFVLVHVSTSLQVCERRDRKGLYAKARAGLIPNFTGVSAPYQEPTDADLVLDTAITSTAESRDHVLRLLVARKLLKLPGDQAAER